VLRQTKKSRNMNIRKFPLAMATVFLATSFSIGSCKKNKTAETDEDTTEANDHVAAENASSDIINIGSQATDNSSGGLNTYKTVGSEQELSFCATVKRDTLHRIDSVIFDGSSCMDGRVRNGILIFNYSASAIGAKHYRDPGFKCSVTSSGYTVDDRSINIINKTIENTTPSDFNPATTNLTWKITGHIQVSKSAGTHDFTYTRNKTLLNTSDPNVYHGAATAISWSLAKVGITGDASGTTAKGKSYTANVTSQLVRDFGGCTIGKRHPFIQGTLEFKPDGKATRYIDFGNGSCDLDVTVTINGKSHILTL